MFFLPYSTSRGTHYQSGRSREDERKYLFPTVTIFTVVPLTLIRSMVQEVKGVKNVRQALPKENFS